MMKKVIIAGGGAAGLAAAISAAWAGASVTVCEKDDRVGKKLLRTGNGRCNLSNADAGPEAYNAPEFTAPVLERLGCGAVRGFFERMGLMTYADADGRVYPSTDAAASVLDVLRLECAHRGVELRCGFDAAEAYKDARGFTVTARDKSAVHGEALIVSTGGGSGALRRLGLKSTGFSPILCPLKTDIEPVRGLSGIRVRCAAELLRNGEVIDREKGELLFRDYGVSGIMVFDLSRFSQKGDIISLDLMPDISLVELVAMLKARESALGWREGSDYLAGMFHSRVAQALLRRAGSRDAGTLAHTAKAYTLTVLGCGDVKQAQVTRGGLSLEQFVPETLECAKIPGLYACGEALNIDGRCGGYNLHWAFASGITAGRGAGGMK